MPDLKIKTFIETPNGTLIEVYPDIQLDENNEVVLEYVENGGGAVLRPKNPPRR
jgi:hypothetical protein